MVPPSEVLTRKNPPSLAGRRLRGQNLERERRITHAEWHGMGAVPRLYMASSVFIDNLGIKPDKKKERARSVKTLFLVVEQ